MPEAKNRWPGNATEHSSSRATFPITPNNTPPEFANGETCRAMIVGTGGDLVVKCPDGSVGFYPALAAGVIHPIMAIGVYVSATYGGGTVTTSAAIIQGVL